MKILFLARSLHVGGAERQLVALARGLRTRGHDVRVAVFKRGGAFDAEIESASIPLDSLEKRGRWDLAHFASALVRLVRSHSPDVVHSYLDVPNVVAALLAPLFGPTKIVWGVRASYLDFSRYNWLARVSHYAQAPLARVPDLAIVNSLVGMRELAAFGIARDRIAVVPNGIDTERFAPSAEGRARLRREWGIAEDELLAGIVARFDPMKNHETFLRAAAMVAGRLSRARFVCIGGGEEPYESELRALAHALGLDPLLRWAGARSDVAAVDSALDLAVSSSSYGEGFPNSVAEAMSCGTPCVVTDVGDSAVIVGDAGLVVPARRPDLLAGAILEAMGRLDELRPRTRPRIESLFSLQRLIETTEALLMQCSQNL
jgi:glycosyltransferase involved in cell wall biosynthesis